MLIQRPIRSEFYAYEAKLIMLLTLSSAAFSMQELRQRGPHRSDKSELYASHELEEQELLSESEQFAGGDYDSDDDVHQKSTSCLAPWSSLKNATVKLCLKVNSNSFANKLLKAAKTGDLTTVNDLLKAGGNPNITVAYQGTALTCSAANGHTRIVRSLLRAKANPNLPNRYATESKTALICAVSNGHIESVQALLDAGADVDSHNPYGWTALTYAAKSGNTKIVQILLEAATNANANYIPDNNALSCAAANNHTEILQALLDAKANVDGLFYDVQTALFNDGQTALMYAAKYGRTEAVKALLKAGANVNIVDKNGNTAIISAHREGHTEIVQAILEAGVDLDALLIEFARKDSRENVKILAGLGAKIPENVNVSEYSDDILKTFLLIKEVESKINKK